MNQLHPEWREFLESLVLEKVDFVIVGAVAVAFHARPRLTGDIDVLVRANSENAKRLLKAISRFGFGELGLKEQDFVVEGFTIQLGREPRRIDILTSITGVSFEEIWNEREFGKVSGLDLPFISRNLLIRNKKEIGRYKDLGDVETLESTRSIRRTKGQDLDR